MADWFYTRSGERQGPVPIETLRTLREQGQLQGSDLVWREGMAQWVPAVGVPELGFLGAPAAAAPLGTLSYAQPGGSDVICTARTFELLRQTRPWVRLISVLMFIGIAFMLLGACVMIGISSSRPGNVPFAVGFGLMYVLMSFIYIMPAIYLSRYASRISELQQYRREDKLEQAIEAQKSFWKFIGIIALVILLLYAAVALVAVIARLMR
jgi:hypothetical protein